MGPERLVPQKSLSPRPSRCCVSVSMFRILFNMMCGIALASPSCWAAKTCASNRDPICQEHRYNVVALVNQEPISSHDVLFRTRLMLLSSQGIPSEEMLRQLEEQTLSILMGECLRAQVAKKYGTTVEEAAFQRHVENIEKKTGLAPGQLLKSLEEQGIPQVTFKRQVLTAMAWARYIERRYGPTIILKDADIDRKRKQWVEDRKKAQYQVAEIVLHVDPLSPRKTVEERAHRVLRLLQEGCPFVQVAEQFSQAQSRKEGGLLGWIPLDRLPPELRPLVAKANPGDIIGPVCFPARCVSQVAIVLVIDKKPSPPAVSVPPREFFENMVREEILEQRSNQEFERERRNAYYRTFVKSNCCPAQIPKSDR